MLLILIKGCIQMLKNKFSQMELPNNNKIEVADFFSKNWKSKLDNIPESLPIIGNPP